MTDKDLKNLLLLEFNISTSKITEFKKSWP